MKIAVLFAAFALTILFLGCKSDLVSPTTYLSCSRPVSTANGYRYPASIAQYTKISASGNYLAFVQDDNSKLCVYDLNKSLYLYYTLRDKMPSSTYLVGIGEFQWCPYSDESILVTLSTSTDTNGSGNLIYGESLYLLNIKNGSITRTMPALMSICGATDMQLLSWLPTSAASNDTILIRYRLKAFGGDPFLHKKYHVQSDRIEPVDNLNCLAGLCCFDKMGKMFAHIKTASVAEDYRLYIGSELVQLPHFESIQYVRISRDGKYIALDVLPPLTDSIRGLSSEIWLINTNKWLANKADTSYLSVINLQNINCSYSFGGAYPEFLTDSTLALNLHKDGDATSPPYEVTFGGKLVRRISVIR